KEQQERHVQHGQYLSMAMWATKSLETGNIDERLTLDDALARARSWDRPDLFDARTESYDERYRAAAVVGAESVAAKNAPPEAWSDELASRCLNIMERAATVVEGEGDLIVRSAALLMHPAVFAAHGYSALLARDYATDRCKRALLNLAVDA